MSKIALRFNAVSKRFGRHKALDDFSAEVPTGKMVGFVGPNGAGKTTAFSLVGGFLYPDSGEIDILSMGAPDGLKLKGRVGILPQDAELSLHHTPAELLVHLGMLGGLSRRQACDEAARLLTLVRLEDKVDCKIKTLSHGMRRRVAVATALIGNPELVLLDEPLAGLDPVQAHGLREVFLDRIPGQTIVISSHNLDELERICDWVVMMDSGRTLRQGSIAEVTGATEMVEWTLAPVKFDLSPLETLLAGHKVVLDGFNLTVTILGGVPVDDISLIVAGFLTEIGVAIREVKRGVGLEEQFLQDHLDAHGEGR